MHPEDPMIALFLIAALTACTTASSEDCDEIASFAYDAGVYAADNCLAYKDVHAQCFGDDAYMETCDECFRQGFDAGFADATATREADTGLDTGAWCGQ